MGTENIMRDQHSQIVGCFFLLLVPLLQIKPTDAADAASDSIVLGESLTGNETRISKGGIFKLGFFSLNDNNLEKWYVGIWYVTASPQTVAWVANGEQPLQNASGVLNLTEDGSLLLSYGRSLVWSSKGNGKKPSSAVIMDTGNLVVLSAENTSEIIWQSFDHPVGDTWLPGMKIGMGQRVTSWKNPWDPSPGSYALQTDPNGAEEFELIWKNRTTYWDTGVWNGKYFPKTPNMTPIPLHDYSYVNNGSYKYFIYTYANHGLTYISRFVMDKSGQMRVYILVGNAWSQIWQQPLSPCEVYAVCGPYGLCNNNNVESCNCVPGFVPKESREWESQQWTSGCVRKTTLQCSHSRNRTTTDGFVELSGKSTPPDGVPYTGQGQCQEACLTNCSCTAYAYVLNGTSQTCVMWFGELLNLYDSSDGTPLFLRLAASDLPDSSNSNQKATLARIVGGIVSGLIAVLTFVFLFLWCRRRSRSSVTEYAPGTLAVFTYRELQNATKNFSERLGGGGFGSVFKGSLTDGSVVAVKKLEGVNQGEKQFRTEVSTIGTTQHVNLVRLRGFCTEGSRRLLVYEYMPNGSLNSVLFQKSHSDDQTQNKVLDWKTRFGIAVGTARGIAYLHEQCRDCIIHCDIKPENILLDSNFCPKIADFGLAKLLGREFSHALTTMRGTRGYLAPEWLSGLPITPKADVYSFGMTLFEIISGRRNIDGVSESSEMFFPTWAVTQVNSGNAMEVLDKKLMNDAEAEQVKRASIVAGWCIQDNEDERPAMRKVLQILEGTVHVPPLPPVPFSLQSSALKPDSLVLFFWDKDSASAHNDTSHSPSTTL